MTEMNSFKAYVLTGRGPAAVQQLTENDLPDGDVTIDVTYSSLNYKDGLAVSGKGKIARDLPMVCGIDLAGTVSSSDSPDWVVGDEVVVTGWGLSETHPGGYTSRQRLRSEWLVRRPEGLSLSQTMAVGTAGLTAMLCVLRLEDAGVTPDSGEVLVTGAAGGVGSVAVALLSKLGFDVAASTGRAETHDYLRELGASRIIDRADLADTGKPLQKERWAAAIDTVAGPTLANVISQLEYGGSVAACGLASGSDLPTTVLPFILRGVNLLGVDSVMCPLAERERAWARLVEDLPIGLLDSLSETRAFAEIPHLAEQILDGQVRGRVVIDIQNN